VSSAKKKIENGAGEEAVKKTEAADAKQRLEEEVATKKRMKEEEEAARAAAVVKCVCGYIWALGRRDGYEQLMRMCMEPSTLEPCTVDPKPSFLNPKPYILLDLLFGLHPAH